jgi:hypothetical protein
MDKCKITMVKNSSRVTLPIKRVEDLKWTPETKLEFKKVGKKLVIQEVVK